MNPLVALGKLALVLPLLAAPVVRASAQSAPGTPRPDQLFGTIAALDSAVFDAYNRCELEKFGAFFTDDVEFYHDQGGVTLGREKLTDAIRQNICGKVSRELVPGTLEVYPMRGYGAIEIGVHRFHHPNAERSRPTGEAKFVHLWQNRDGTWKITRVLSFDHHALPNRP